MKKITAGWLLITLVISLVVGGCYQASAPAPVLPKETPSAPEETSAPAGGTTQAVTIKDFAFSPKEITVKAGDTVTWTQQDTAHHTATGSAWDSGDLGPGQTYSRTFAEAGTHDYICSYHPNMKGKVIVK